MDFLLWVGVRLHHSTFLSSCFHFLLCVLFYNIKQHACLSAIKMSYSCSSFNWTLFTTQKKEFSKPEKLNFTSISDKKGYYPDTNKTIPNLTSTIEHFQKLRILSGPVASVIGSYYFSPPPPKKKKVIHFTRLPNTTTKTSLQSK